MPRVSSTTKTPSKTTKTPSKTTKTTRAVKAKVVKAKTPAKKPVRRVKKDIDMMFSPVKEKMGKAQIIQTLCESAGLDKKQAVAAYTVFGDLILASVCKGSIGHFALPGIVDVKTRKVPAKKVAAIKKGTLVRNPRTGEMVEHAGRAAYTKPAAVKVKVRALSKLRNAAL